MQRRPALTALGVTGLGILAFPVVHAMTLFLAQGRPRPQLGENAVEALWSPQAFSAILAMLIITGGWAALLLHLDQLRQNAQRAAGQGIYPSARSVLLILPLYISAFMLMMGEPISYPSVLAFATLFTPLFGLALHWHLKHLEWPRSGMTGAK